MIVQLASLQHELGETSMIMAEADTKFLKRILMVLVAGTLATGLMAGLATVKAERGTVAEQLIP
jgi:hypothetical protein